MADWRPEFVERYRRMIDDGEKFIASAERGESTLFTIKPDGERIDDTPMLIERERAIVASLKALVAKVEDEMNHAHRT